MARPPQARCWSGVRSIPAGRDRAAAGNLGGYLIAYLNIDEVIRIIREEDEPKQVMMARWELTDIQAEAILNLRLRALAQAGGDRDPQGVRCADRRKARDRGAARLGSQAVEDDPLGRSARCATSDSARIPRLGKRRTTFADAPEHDDADIHHAMVEKEPVTVVVSEKGWLRAMKGHTDHSLFAFKEGDAEAGLPCADHRQDDRLHHRRQILHDRRGPAAGRARPWRADPHHRRHGKRPGHRHRLRPRPVVGCCSRRHEGYGFVVPEAEVVANTRKGKQVMNVKSPDEAQRLPVRVGRSRRDRRRKPQAARLPAVEKFRKWRAARASGCSATRMAACSTQDLCDGRRPDLAGFGRPHLHPDREELAEWIGDGEVWRAAPPAAWCRRAQQSGFPVEGMSGRASFQQVELMKVIDPSP
jgi:hypothetical protein